jgi:hypothetical protein
VTPCKKAPTPIEGRRNNSVATLLAFVTETRWCVLSGEILFVPRLVSDRKPDFDNIPELTGSGRMNFGIGLSCDERQRHQGHYRQADYFVEVSYK